jgi:hypothetical protein
MENKMKRTKEPPGIEVYYDTLTEIFRLQSGIMTATLTHSGERGRNDEQYLRDFLKKTLPNRFSIGTGFVVSANPSTPRSGQNDIVISDQYWNPSLYNELAAEVYPVETVYATIEVKGVLEKARKGRKKTTDLDDSLSNIAKIRTLAKHKKYIEYAARPKKSDSQEKKVIEPNYFEMSLPPRAYVFAYAKKGWRTLNDFRLDLEEHLGQHPDAHLHGIVLLEKNWFAFQESYNSPISVQAFEGNALIRFINTLLRGIQSMPMAIASIDDYHRAGLLESVLAGDYQESAFMGDPEPPDATYEE